MSAHECISSQASTKSLYCFRNSPKTLLNNKGSDHFDGSVFYNPEPEPEFFSHIKWIGEMETVEWPENVDDSHYPPPIDRVGQREPRITYINHATVLIQMDGVNILTNLIWSEKAGPVSWLDEKRVRTPGMKMDDFPNIYIILISHDHLDMLSLKKLIKRHRRKSSPGWRKEPFETIDAGNITEMDWWQEHHYFHDIKITFGLARHNSGRGLFDGNKTLWDGFVIEGKKGDEVFMRDTPMVNLSKKLKKNLQVLISPSCPLAATGKDGL
jgi:hypothetical protein